MKNIDLLITNFFNKDSFDSDELNNLREVIIKEIGYRLYKSYENIINLHLLKFNLNKSDTISKKRIRKKEINKFINHEFIGRILPDVAKNLVIPSSTLITIFKKEKKIVNEKTIIDEELYNAINKYIISRKAFLKSHNIKATKVSNKKYDDNSSTVYDKLSTTNGSVKLIYIRSK